MNNTGASSIVCFTILVLPVMLDEEYWSCKAHNTGNSGILHPAILVILVL
jgi:hypothetical protein